MDNSSALGSQVLTVEPYSGLDVEGVWFREKRYEVIGA